jgi:hypothetical protein
MLWCDLGQWGLRFMVLSFLAVSSAFAQSPNRADDIEEIVVTEKRSLRSLREEVWNAEEAVYEIFNEIYAGTDYEMSCKNERPLKDPGNPSPNLWTVRACRSSLAHDLYQQQMVDYADYICGDE